jgi:hypothetical protein
MAGSGDLRELRQRAHAEGNARLRRRRKVCVRVKQPGEHGGVDTRRPQLERFIEVGDPEVIYPRLQGSAGGSHCAVPVTVCLHDRHRVRGADEPPHGGGVLTERRGADARLA